MSNMFTPNTTVAPNVDDTGKLDEMIKLLQDQIGNATKMKQYSQNKEDRAKTDLTERASKQALVDLYKPKYPDLQQYFDDPNITSGVLGGIINQKQEIEVKNRVAQKEIDLMEQDKIDRQYISIPVESLKTVDAAVKAGINAGASNNAIMQMKQSVNDWQEQNRLSRSGGGGENTPKDKIDKIEENFQKTLVPETRSGYMYYEGDNGNIYKMMVIYKDGKWRYKNSLNKGPDLKSEKWISREDPRLDEISPDSIQDGSIPDNNIETPPDPRSLQTPQIMDDWSKYKRK